MNPFNQMQPMGQRSTPPLSLGSPLNQVSKVIDPASSTSYQKIKLRLKVCLMNMAAGTIYKKHQKLHADLSRTFFSH